MLKFPAYLGHKSAIDMDCIDMMRPLFDAGIKPMAFQKMIKEMHTKEHIRRALLHESSSLGKLNPSAIDRKMFSAFADKEGYNGYVPGHRFYRRSYIKFHSTIREFFDNSIKLLGVLVLYMDVSYKAPKKLKRINKQPLLKGLVTVMNECRQIRQQFFIPTDAHDLYETPLTEMKNTLDQCGHMGPRLAYTDNPSRDYAFLLKNFPSLQARQENVRQNGRNCRRKKGKSIEKMCR